MPIAVGLAVLHVARIRGTVEGGTIVRLAGGCAVAACFGNLLMGGPMVIQAQAARRMIPLASDPVISGF